MLFRYLVDLAQSWSQAKIWLSQVLGLSPDALHVHVSILAMLAAAVLWRQRMDRVLPWLTVLALEIVNEMLDLSAPDSGENTLHASLHDLANTMFLPTIILVCLRFTRTWRRA
ncbi:hypothetical protein DFR49_1756 [Hephaestia caeni]|uniref:VanZ like protein n=1 Tax=Hephaestia caeni TaxID=645617 RepID=A0A397PBQ7_9SPHN|nr:hypothetical protein [Hephaestia caeni]RIA43534.1 hypothetical protein DFR49_1756 [Hephaestia caeni]